MARRAAVERCYNLSTSYYFAFRESGCDPLPPSPGSGRNGSYPNRLRSAGLSAAGGGLVLWLRRFDEDKLEVDCRIHHFVARSKAAVGIAADIIKQAHGPVPCLSLATIGAAGLRQLSEALRTRYCTRMKRRAIAASLRQYATIDLSSKWPVTTPVVPKIIKMSVGR